MKTNYQSPGHVDALSKTLLSRWNTVIRTVYEGLQSYQSRFFALNPAEIGQPEATAITWFADPATPASCKDIDIARQLADWGVRGRQALHDEYCEYHIVYRTDQQGKQRPKRVHVTTELREYWTMLAMASPTKLRNVAAEVLGYVPSWQDLYGVADPLKLSESARELAFSTQNAGHGGRADLQKKGVPAQPIGKLNTDNLLFMTSPVNGLDDLLFIFMFGAHPYATRVDGQLERATKEQIFRYHQTEEFACRHADPAASMSAYNAVFDGRPVAFADPVGLYMHTFASNAFSYQGRDIPDKWVRFSRGRQRLEFGPGDDEAIFLDDLMVALGGDEYPVTGGFQVVQQLEIGPAMLFGDPIPVHDDDYIVLNTSADPIRCNESKTCEQVDALHKAYLNNQIPAVETVSPRIVKPVAA